MLGANNMYTFELTSLQNFWPTYMKLRPTSHELQKETWSNFVQSLEQFCIKFEATSCELCAIIHHPLIYQSSYFSSYLCLPAPSCLPIVPLTTNTSSKTYGHPVLWLGDSLASSFAIFGALYSSCQRLTNSLPFLLTVCSLDTGDRSISSPLPKRLKHITHSHHSNIGAKQSTEQRTSPRLRTNFTPTLYTNYVRTPQLHTNFALTSYVDTGNFEMLTLYGRKCLPKTVCDVISIQTFVVISQFSVIFAV